MADVTITRLDLADGRTTESGWTVLAGFTFEMAGIRVVGARLSRSRNGIEVTLPSYVDPRGKRRHPFQFVDSAACSKVEKTAYAEYERQRDQHIGASVTRNVVNRSASCSTGPATVPVSVARVPSIEGAASWRK